jgi:exosortase D (VPLPA-CTERM-specific)
MSSSLVDRVGRMPLLFAIGLLLSIVVYASGLAGLVDRWSKQEEYSHGFFIPLIAIWLLWQRREALRASLAAPSWYGLLLLMVAVAMLLLGELTAIFILVQYGFILSLVGLVFCLGGMPLARVSILPIAFLIFAIPLPYFVDSQLSWRLQLLSSQIGVGVLRGLGISVFLEGNVIDLGAYKLQVVDACSGLRYLYPLLSIGFLMAYMYQAPLWRRGALFLTTIPVTVLMNSLRIAAVGVLVQRWGSGMADGFMHYFEGWIIFIACLMTLLFEVWLFERFGARRKVLDVLTFPFVRGFGAVTDSLPSTRHPLVFGMTLLVVAGVVVQGVGHRQEVLPERTSLAAFPLTIGEWQASKSLMETQVEVYLGLDDYVLADYRRGEQIVNFYAAFYGSQRKGVSPHSPQVCIPGGGWLITSLERVPVTLVDGSTFEVNRTLIERDGQRQLVYYWFEQRGRRIANEYWMKWYLLVDALVRNRSDGALVRVTTPVLASESAGNADQRVVDFVKLTAPKLGAYVPH